MRFTIRRSAIGKRVQVAVLLLALYWALTVCYVEVVAPIYNFGGFSLLPKELPFIELCLVMALAIYVPLNIHNATQMFLWMSVIFLLLPATILSATQQSDEMALSVMYFGVFYVVFMAGFVRKLLPRYKNVSPDVGDFTPYARVISLMLALVLIALWVQSPGIKTLDFSEVYEHRFEFNESLSFPLNYLVPISGGALAAFAMAYSLAAGHFMLSAVVMVFGVVMFGLTTHKMFVIVPFFSLAWFFIVKFRNAVQLLMSAILILVVMTIFSVDTSVSVLGNSFANRLIFIPARIHYEYISAFSDLSFQFWAESKISMGLINSSLQEPAVNYIAERMTGDPAIGANTGWIANGYMNAGVAGVVIYGTLIAIILAVIDRWAKEYPRVFVLGAFASSIFALINSMDLLMQLLTGGMGVSLIVFYAANKTGYCEKPICESARALTVLD